MGGKERDGLGFSCVRRILFPREKEREGERERGAQATEQAETKMATFQYLNLKILSVILLSGLS